MPPSYVWDLYCQIPFCVLDVQRGSENPTVRHLLPSLTQHPRTLIRQQPKLATFKKMIGEAIKLFPNFKVVATTLRNARTATRNDWSAIVWSDGQFYEAPLRENLEIMDRVGGGDSFMGGLIYGLRKYKDEPQKALNFAAAAACLKHSILGDFNAVSVSEVETLMGGDASGRVSR